MQKLEIRSNIFEEKIGGFDPQFHTLKHNMLPKIILSLILLWNESVLLQ